MTGPLPITVVILTFNEAPHIRRCLERIRPLVQRMVVIDSFSTDDTPSIARACGAEVLQRRWLNYADQFQWALDNAGITTEWVLRLDADEYFEPASVDEILHRLGTLPPDVTGVNFRRKVIFRGRWIRFGGFYPTILLRLWRHGAARIESRWMDEHVVLQRGRSVTFAHDFVDENLNDISWWTDKHNGYATRQMIDFVAQEQQLFARDSALEKSQSGQARLKRLLKVHVFARMPLYLRGTLYFLFRYFILLGFLDGRQGFLFHFLQGWWNWMLVDAKIDEARSFIARHGLEAFKLHLHDRWGYRL
ncbi:glycosyltransferase family 2 protein [Tianweitania sp. BSSL-BM11]|uniref:Glycosyltransferase family 2 protein n=1 Tax=Tianweitania aestuarii TaxID=2814886 RepID=A0ABS5RR61_9HYPH|nr:glycosyltransferase family 2 protein [Tianweitania aestuarii]MBS9719464.1 glycosyltransferase family 2 protein [Tianweitania aestuarii]